MNELIRKILLIFTIFSTNELFSDYRGGWALANGSALDSDGKCTQSKKCALYYIGQIGVPNSLYNLATQMKNYIDGAGNPNKTANLFQAISNLTNDVSAGTKTKYLADIVAIKYYIDNLIALNSKTPASTWATWFKQFIRTINELFDINAPHSPVATASEVINAIQLIPLTGTAINKVTKAINSINTINTIVGNKSEQTGLFGKLKNNDSELGTNHYEKYSSLVQDMAGDLYNIKNYINALDLINLQGALISFRSHLLELISKNITELGGGLTKIKTNYNSIITQLTAIGYIQNPDIKKLLQ